VKRFIVVCWGILLVSPAFGQDMPLSQVLIDGEGWHEAVVDREFAFAGVGSANSPSGKLRFSIDTKTKTLLFGDKPVTTGIAEPSGIIFWKDGGTLVVGDAAGKHLYAFRVKPDGTLDAREKYYTLRTPANGKSGVRTLTVDQSARLYAATSVGVQIFDPTGRICGVLNSPLREPVTAIAFGGEKGDELYIVCGDRLWHRKTKAQGVALTSPKK
jgi:sugar lactone lactonase YvrE